MASCSSCKLYCRGLTSQPLIRLWLSNGPASFSGVWTFIFPAVGLKDCLLPMAGLDTVTEISEHASSFLGSVFKPILGFKFLDRKSVV